MRALVAGWFSIEGGGATAGDLLTRDVVCEWLADAGVAYDVANEPAMGEGVDWFRVSPDRYTHLVFVCGPVGPDLQVAPLVDRFAECRRIAVNVSLVGDARWRPFDVVLARDGRRTSRPDVSLLAPRGDLPVVARVQIHQQAEYPDARVAEAHAAFDELLAARPAAAFEVDTRLDPSVPGRRTPAEVESLIRRADVVLTTRLHGLVLALANGIPALAADVVPGGAKVSAQARALGWPAVLKADELDGPVLARELDWCLTGEARTLAAQCAGAAAPGAEAVGAELLRALAGVGPLRRLLQRAVGVRG